MNLILIPSEQGGLGKSKTSSQAPQEIVGHLTKKVNTITLPVVNSNLEQTNKNIYNNILSSGKAIILGGDHSITFPAFKAFIKNNPGAGIIIFDAHPDCVNNFIPPTHEDFVKVLVEEKIVDPSRIILIGLRQIDPIEFTFLKKHNIRFFTMKQIFEIGVKEVCDIVMETANAWPSFYLSLDIDVVDPAFAPGTGYREPAGLTSSEFLYFIDKLKRLKNLGMVDLVEIAPGKDLNDLTIKLGAKVIDSLF